MKERRTHSVAVIIGGAVGLAMALSIWFANRAAALSYESDTPLTSPFLISFLVGSIYSLAMYLWVWSQFQAIEIKDSYIIRVALMPSLLALVYLIESSSPFQLKVRENVFRLVFPGATFLLVAGISAFLIHRRRKFIIATGQGNL